MTGKVAWVGGAASGQGEAEVRRFVAEGASVGFGNVLADDGTASTPHYAGLYDRKEGLADVSLRWP